MNDNNETGGDFTFMGQRVNQWRVALCPISVYSMNTESVNPAAEQTLSCCCLLNSAREAQ